MRQLAPCDGITTTSNINSVSRRLALPENAFEHGTTATDGDDEDGRCEACRLWPGPGRASRGQRPSHVALASARSNASATSTTMQVAAQRRITCFHAGHRSPINAWVAAVVRHPHSCLPAHLFHRGRLAARPYQAFSLLPSKRSEPSSQPRRCFRPIFPSVLLSRDPTGARCAAKLENCKRRILRRTEYSGEKKKQSARTRGRKTLDTGEQGRPDRADMDAGKPSAADKKATQRGDQNA